MESSNDTLQNSLLRRTKKVERLHERIASQIRFGRWLCDTNPDLREEWTRLLDDAEARVAAVMDRGSVDDLENAISDAEAMFTPLGETAKSHTIYCVGHAHIDMNWQWSWPETVAVTNDTFTSVLRLMDEFPSFVFSQSQASVYRIIEKYNPPMLDDIAAKIQEGRWEVTASHWVETEKNIVSAESLCRHILYTRKYLKELFAIEPEDVRIDWSPDTFGHAHTVPTYLAGGGIKYLYHHRPGVHGEQPRPRVFWWQAPDGSRVLAWNDMAFGYNGQIRPDPILRSLAETHREARLPFSLFVYGVGDHGGGPTRRDLLYGLEMGRWPLFPVLTFSRADSFYELLEEKSKDLPVLDYELNFEFTGCYTSQSLIKKANRFAEKKLIGAEIAAVVARASVGNTYRYDIFEEGWRNTLFGHFHDIIPGSGVRDTRTYSHGLYQETVAGTGSITAIALRALAGKVDTLAAAGSASPATRTIAAGVGKGTENGGMSQYEYSAEGGARCVLLFNPLPYRREEVVETTIWEGFEPWVAMESVEFAATSPEGATAGAQVLERGTYWGHRFVRIAYPVDVPAIGYAVYVIRESNTETAAGESRHLGIEHVCRYAVYERGPEGIENDLIQVEIDPSTGGLRSLLDKATGIEFVGGETPIRPVLRHVVERPRTMSAWEIEHHGPEIDPELLAIERIDRGPIVASITLKYRIKDSTAFVTYRVQQGDPNLYLQLEIEWNERGGADVGTPTLRLAVPAVMADPTTDYEIPFGSITRAMTRGEEVPALRWASVSGKIGSADAGLLLMNDCKHGHSLNDGSLYLTLIRSSFEPDSHPEIGNHQINCAIRPFTGPLEVPAAIHHARIFDHPIEVSGTDIHEGALPAKLEAIAWSSDSLVLDAVKMAEDGTGIICRIHNPTDGEGGGTLELSKEIFGPAKHAVATDLMERAAGGSSVSFGNGRATVTVPPRGICTAKIEIG